jgi:hypothetical protein
MNNSNNIFSSKFFATIALALLVVFQSCKKNDVAEVAPAAAENDNIASLQQAVASSFDLSADKVTYNKIEKNFVVDGDGIVSLEDAKNRFSSNGTAGAANGANHRRYMYVVAAAKVNTIKIYTPSTIPAAWVSVLDSAIKNWNASGSKVKMQRVTTTTGATTGVSLTNNGSTTMIASATYPDALGNAGKGITINTYYSYLSEAQKIFAMTHELGHIIGLSHTDALSGSLIAGTPTTDAGSIMNSVCLNWSAFTSGDLTAVRTLYPM